MVTQSILFYIGKYSSTVLKGLSVLNQILIELNIKEEILKSILSLL